MKLIVFLASETPGWATAMFTAIAVLIFYGIKSLFSKKDKND
jgi:hypothetical protein